MTNNIRPVRLARGLSIAELARRVNRSPSTVSRWERKLQGIPWDARLALARELEVDLPILFPEAGPAYEKHHHHPNPREEKAS